MEELIDKRKRYIEAERENGFNIKSILSGLYDDPSHFIYEILQNAEDAHANEIIFKLFSDKIVVLNDGVDFIFEDVDSITSIGKSTKTEDLNAIGKFGIGFKSVFAITNTPTIRSGEYSFKIIDYVLPNQIKDNIKSTKKTQIEIPFNHPERKKDECFRLIEETLNHLGYQSLLFLQHLKRIQWEVNGVIFGHLERKENYIDKWVKKVKLISEDEQENWLIFERIVDSENNRKVQVAYKIEENEDNEEKIVPVSNAKLFVYFLTDKETDLHFLINGPYRTTPARDNIPSNDEWNKRLINETAILIAESIVKIKELGLLNIDFLNMLPINPYNFVDRPFEEFYTKVKEIFLSNEKLIPSDNRDFISTNQGLLGGTSDLRELLSSKQLKELFNREHWINGDLTKYAYRDLFEYLNEELDIPEITEEKFVRKFSIKFIEKQKDNWVINFYKYLINHDGLLKLRRLNLKSNPIIRLDDNSHMSPFDEDGYPQVYLPTFSKEDRNYRILKKNIAKVEDLSEFFDILNLKTPSKSTLVIEKILPKYSEKDNTVPQNENLKDLKVIIETLKSNISKSERDKLLAKIKKVPFLYAKNANLLQSAYKFTSDIYLDERFTGDKSISEYFEGYDKFWVLEDYYEAFSDETSDGTNIFEKMGCISTIKVSYKQSNSYGRVVLREMHGWHERGLYEFDPNATIECLEYALNNMNLNRAKVIWNLLLVHYKRISGTIETCSRKDYSRSNKTTRYSTMGRQVTENVWIPDKKGRFYLPSEISISNIHEIIEIESQDAKNVCEKLSIKKEEPILSDDEISQNKRLIQIDDITNNIKAFSNKDLEIVNRLIESIQISKEEKEDVTIYDIFEAFKDLDEAKSQEIEEYEAIEQSWSSLTYEEEEQIQNNYGENITPRLEQISKVYTTRINLNMDVKDKINPKSFLKLEYDGCCQICNTRLNVTRNPPLFYTYRIINLENKRGWANLEFNVLCLCPNCFMKLKYGNKNLNNIFQYAEKVGKNEVAPEPIDERGGKYYIIDINVLGKKEKIFYSQRHMRKIAGFLSTNPQ